jgi:hypothetical protein
MVLRFVRHGWLTGSLVENDTSIKLQRFHAKVKCGLAYSIKSSLNNLYRLQKEDTDVNKTKRDNYSIFNDFWIGCMAALSITF